MPTTNLRRCHCGARLRADDPWDGLCLGDYLEVYRGRVLALVTPAPTDDLRARLGGAS